MPPCACTIVRSWCEAALRCSLFRLPPALPSCQQEWLRRGVARATTLRRALLAPAAAAAPLWPAPKHPSRQRRATVSRPGAPPLQLALQNPTTPAHRAMLEFPVQCRACRLLEMEVLQAACELLRLAAINHPVPVREQDHRGQEGGELLSLPFCRDARGVGRFAWVL